MCFSTSARWSRCFWIESLTVIERIKEWERVSVRDFGALHGRVWSTYAS